MKIFSNKFPLHCITIKVCLNYKVSQQFELADWNLHIYLPMNIYKNVYIYVCMNISMLGRGDVCLLLCSASATDAKNNH